MRIKKYCINFLLLVIFFYLPMFFLSAILFFNNKKSITEVKKIELDYLKSLNIKKIDLIKEGYYPIFYPNIIAKKLNNNNNIYPLSSLPYRKTLLCDEGYGFITYDSDRFGFRNNDQKWQTKSDKNIYLIGDSFVHGSCVKNSDTITGNIEQLIGINTFNLGMGSNGPYEYSAVLKNLVKPLIKQKKLAKNYVVLVFYANDNKLINHKSEFFLNKSNSILFKNGSIDIGIDPKPNSNYLKELTELIESNYPTSQNEMILNISIKKKFQQTFFYQTVTLHPIRKRLKKLIKNSEAYSDFYPNKNITVKNFDNNSITERTISLLADICKENCKPVVVYIPSSLNWRPDRISDDYKMEIKTKSQQEYVTFIDSEKVINRKYKNDYAPKGPHLSINGYKKVSQLIAEELNKLNN